MTDRGLNSWRKSARANFPKRPPRNSFLEIQLLFGFLTPVDVKTIHYMLIQAAWGKQEEPWKLKDALAFNAFVAAPFQINGNILNVCAAYYAHCLQNSVWYDIEFKF